MHFNHKAWLLLVCLSACLAPSLIGCGGCSDDDSTLTKEEQEKKKEEEEKKKKAKKKPKPNYELKRFAVQPNDLLDRNGYAKPGHWTSATVDTIANNFNVSGELTTDAQDIDGVPYRVGSSRPALLPKGARRSFEMVFHVPARATGRPTFARLAYERGGRDLIAQPGGLQRMPSYQFFCMVLAKEQDRYQYLQYTPSFHSLRDTMSSGNRSFFYLLQLPPVINRAPLPSTALAWTNTACIFWDDMPDDVLGEDQRIALVDWLHWGGQLVISGPGSLDLLKDSFLADYLPTATSGSVELEAELQQMRFLTNSGRYTQWNDFRGPKINKPWPCERLKPLRDEDAVLVRAGDGPDANPLVVERRVGRGRVVVTAFRLTQPELSDWRAMWPQFDIFLNACLLRRPPRQFRPDDQTGAITFSWVTGGSRQPAETASHVCGLNYFSRDSGYGNNRPQWLQQEYAALENNYGQYAYNQPQVYEPDLSGRSVNGPGVCGWDDWNDVSEAARTSLNEAAGIKVPDRVFILQVLGVYLLILVPCNWLIFRVLGRLEWAWVAVPVITIGCAIAVVKLAEVNIGFARARTEINVVEVHQGYARAHVTRYTALYTSLSTSYSVNIEDRTGLVMPLADREQLAAWQGRSTIWLHRDKEVELSGFNVASNSMGILHAEQMFDLGGPIKLTKLSGRRVTVYNDSAYTLEDAEVIGPQGVAWLGTLGPGDEASGDFGPRANPPTAERNQPIDEVEDPFANEPGAEPPGIVNEPPRPPSDQIPLSRLLKLARSTPAGEIRLVARSTEELPGMSISPASSQRRYGNVFVIHLQSPNGEAPRRDYVISKEMQEVLEMIKPPKSDPEEDAEANNEAGE